MTLPVEADGLLRLDAYPPLVGTIDVGPILEAEAHEAEAVQLLIHRGRFYVIATGFRSVWEISPRSGRLVAAYRSFSISPAPLEGARISRFGPEGRPCVRVDAANGGPWFLAVDGVVSNVCS